MCLKEAVVVGLHRERNPALPVLPRVMPPRGQALDLPRWARIGCILADARPVAAFDAVSKTRSSTTSVVND